MRERGEHLVHARVDEEEARVAAGPHGGRGQAAVAVALLEEAKEGGADLPRRRAGGTAAAGAAGPAARHGQQQPAPQPGGRGHGAPRRMAAAGARKGRCEREAVPRDGGRAPRHRPRGPAAHTGSGRGPPRPVPAAIAMAVRGVPCLAWCLRRVGASCDWLLLEAGTQVSGRVGTALGAHSRGSRCFLQPFPGGRSTASSRLRRSRPSSQRSPERAPLSAGNARGRGGRAQALESPWPILRLFMSLNSISYLNRVVCVTVT